jgi:hypothetical protein
VISTDFAVTGNYKKEMEQVLDRPSCVRNCSHFKLGREDDGEEQGSTMQCLGSLIIT